MLMSYAFITTGDKLFVVPDGFDRGATRRAPRSIGAFVGAAASSTGTTLSTTDCPGRTVREFSNDQSPQHWQQQQTLATTHQ